MIATTPSIISETLDYFYLIHEFGENYYLLFFSVFLEIRQHIDLSRETPHNSVGLLANGAGSRNRFSPVRIQRPRHTFGVTLVATAIYRQRVCQLLKFGYLNIRH